MRLTLSWHTNQKHAKRKYYTPLPHMDTDINIMGGIKKIFSVRDLNTIKESAALYLLHQKL